MRINQLTLLLWIYVSAILLFSSCSESDEQEHVTLSSIAVLTTNPLHLTQGSQASVEISVNPSNATWTPDVSQIELDRTDIASSHSSRVATHSNYKLVCVEQIRDSNTMEIRQGQYRVVIEDTGNAAEYDEMVAIVINTVDDNGKNVQISSAPFRVIGSNYDFLPKTGLPVVIITTPNSEPVTSKDKWMAGVSMTVLNADMLYNYQGMIEIKGRGNSSWSYPKKPYALKLETKGKLLGMPKHKRWVLLANWRDRTLMRNDVAFEIARRCPGLDWTPRGRFVEVMLNNKHIGNYYLCEQIKVGKNRVNIAELDSTAIGGKDITGGFLMELDKYFDEQCKFRSATKNFPWMFKDPDEVNNEQFAYMQTFVNEMEESLYNNEKFRAREFVDFIDLESFADWWIVYELAMNSEPYWPKSCYMNKDRGGRLKAGPVWDFDFATFLPSNASSYTNWRHVYYDQLFKDAGFKALVKSKWSTQKPAFEDVASYIDDLMMSLKASDKLNHTLWPITATSVNGDESMTYEESVTRLKSAYLDKLNWLDAQINNW